MNNDGGEDVPLLSYKNSNDFPTMTIYSGGNDWKRVSTIHSSVRAEKWVAAMGVGTVWLEMPKWPEFAVVGSGLGSMWGGDKWSWGEWAEIRVPAVTT